MYNELDGVTILVGEYHDTPEEEGFNPLMVGNHKITISYGNANE